MVRHFLNGQWWSHRVAQRLAQQRVADEEARIAQALPYFAALKDKYVGRRGFVIGNGPSLRLSDLELLKNEITLAANKVYLSFQKVSWRPTYLTIADPLVWQKVQDDIWKHHDVVLIPSYLPEFNTGRDQAKTFRNLGNASDLWRVDRGLYFSGNLTAGSYGGYTVTYENLQLAVHLGLNPIYIVGCDHFYRGESRMEPNTSIVTTDIANHFLPGYRTPGEIVKSAPIDEMDESFAQARRYCDAVGVRVFNATRGGHLEAFVRTNFDDLFQ